MKEMNDSCNSEQQKFNQIIPEKIATQQDLLGQQKKQNVAKFLLSATECSIIQRFFPKTYSFQQVSDNKMKNKKKMSKTSNTCFQNYFNVPLNEIEIGLSNQQQPSNMIKKKSKIFAYQSDSIEYKNLGSPIRRVEENDFEGCCSILSDLKKHKLAIYFLDSINSKQPSYLNFQHLMKEPIDFSIIQRRLNEGKYESTSKFKSDIIKIWHNVFACNEKTTQIYKMASILQRHYEKLVKDYERAKNTKQQKKNQQVTQPEIEVVFNKKDQQLQNS